MILGTLTIHQIHLTLFLICCDTEYFFSTYLVIAYSFEGALTSHLAVSIVSHFVTLNIVCHLWPNRLKVFRIVNSI